MGIRSPFLGCSRNTGPLEPSCGVILHESFTWHSLLPAASYPFPGGPPVALPSPGASPKVLPSVYLSTGLLCIRWACLPSRPGTISRTHCQKHNVQQTWRFKMSSILMDHLFQRVPHTMPHTYYNCCCTDVRFSSRTNEILSTISSYRDLCPHDGNIPHHGRAQEIYRPVYRNMQH